MESHVLWTPLQQTGLEQLHLVENDTGVVADGLVIGIEYGAPFRLWYQVWVDSDWNVRECLLQVGGEKGQALHLYTDGLGHWTDAAGVACSPLDGCLDVDISRTPFTNTLPLRRLTLTPGQSADLLVAYITIPDLSVRPVQQRYTCLSRTASGGVYRYEDLENSFTADLLVDAQGLVVDYPGIWKRVEMRPLVMRSCVFTFPQRQLQQQCAAQRWLLSSRANRSVHRSYSSNAASAGARTRPARRQRAGPCLK